MHLAAGKAMDEPAIDGADTELAPLRRALQKPAHFCAGKHGVDRQAGQRHDALGMALFDQFGAVLRRAAALPAEHRAERLAGFAIPDGDGFALVGNGDGRDIDRRGGGGEAGGDRFTDRGPDAVRILFHPTGLRIGDADGR
ncbi:hypothetical protein D3C80_509480 [compost metagenome]